MADTNNNNLTRQMHDSVVPVTGNDMTGIGVNYIADEILKNAVDNGSDLEARGNMAFAEYLAGMAFNNASLGYVHAMAHQLGGFYNLPHGVCNALLLPHVQEYNIKAAAPRLKKVAEFINFLPVIAFDGSSMRQINAGDILDIAMAGTSATLLAKRWESVLLVNVDNETLSRLIANKDAMDALMKSC